MSPSFDEMKGNGNIHGTEGEEIYDLKIPITGHRHRSRRTAMDWSSHLTKESAARRPSALKAAFQHLTIPGIISLGGGLPLPAYFPIHEVVVKVPTVGKWSEEETAKDGSSINIVKYSRTSSEEQVSNKTVNGVVSEERKPKADSLPVVALSSTLQYGLGTGDPHLLSFLKQHTQMVHNPPYEDWSTTLTCGNTYSFYTCLRMLVERGDYLIMEEYAYSSAISTCGPMGIKIVGIKMDDQGMKATSLDSVLSSWDVSARAARKPRVIYLVPTGQNPTGASMFLQRRKDIYKVCQNHNIIIIEDEPYYFLQMEPYTGRHTPVAEFSNESLLNSLIPSFMSLDVDGRVLRMDSLSKTVAPGLRLAWLSGPTQLIERTTRHLELTTQAPSGLSQSVTYDLIARHWNHDGFLGWLGYIRTEYTRRRDVAAQALEKYLPQEVASLTVPTAGMFFWVKITAPEGYSCLENLETTIFERCLREKVLVIPGSFFKAEGDPEGVGCVDESGICYFRGTFAAAAESEVVLGIERFGRSIRLEFGL